MARPEQHHPEKRAQRHKRWYAVLPVLFRPKRPLESQKLHGQELPGHGDSSAELPPLNRSATRAARSSSVSSVILKKTSSRVAALSPDSTRSWSIVPRATTFP